MKVTIETETKKVEVEGLDEDATWIQVMAELVIPALRATGYMFSMEKFADAAASYFEEDIR